MAEGRVTKEELLKVAAFLGKGFYRVTYDGLFVECDSKAREIFGIPQEETNLSKYSIKALYVVPAERELRLHKLKEKRDEPISGTLSMRIEGKNVLLSDVCWFDGSYQDNGNIVGIIKDIEESTLFPKMFDNFPMGLFEIDDDGRVVRVNNKLLKILKYENEDEILGKFYRDFCEDQEVVYRFVRAIDKEGFAHDIVRLRDANNKIIEVECFAQDINEFERARWGMINDVTWRERSIRAVDKMPTGFYHIEYEKDDEGHEKESLTQCNDRFAKILGIEKKEEAIGINLSKVFHPDKEVSDKFFRDLYEADSRGEALINYIFKTKRIDDQRTIYISIDVHLVKDNTGKVIGREGTIRDATSEIELQNEVMETQKRLEKTTVDINKLIHTFLHPVVKFAGQSDLLYLITNVFRETMQLKIPGSNNIRELGNELLGKLIEVKESLIKIEEDISFVEENSSDIDLSGLKGMKVKLIPMINLLDHSLQTEESDYLLENSVRGTALRVLEELNKIGYFKKKELKSLLKKDLIEFLQGILFDYLIQSAGILVGETQIMKRGVEALRGYIGLKKERKYAFLKRDIGEILEENIRLFKPVLAEEGIEIDYKKAGNLTAEVSTNDIDRVICNLLLNAKKYSYREKGRYVKVKARELQPANEVELSIENYGIPIKREEIDSGDIWAFGYRGKLAYESDRDGTGVGLADARDVIQAHNGVIMLTSNPAQDDGEPPRYKAPYITRVTIRIPKKARIQKE
jgi:PAS domain S-box-containing protein